MWSPRIAGSRTWAAVQAALARGAVVELDALTASLEAGRLAGEWMVQQLEGKGKVAMIEGTPGSQQGRDRKTGFHEVIKAAPGINLVSSIPANFERAKGMEVMEDILTANPDLAGVFAANDEMALGALEALKQRGANVVPVPVYRWALPEDTAPLKQVLSQILAGQVQVMLVTNAAQIDHVMQIVEQEGTTAQFRATCRKLVVASIGPTASERIRSHGLTVDFEPSHGKMGILVKETSEQVHQLSEAKRRS